MSEPLPPQLADESRWCTEHTALIISTLKWALLGAAAGVYVGLGTKIFFWGLAASGQIAGRLRAGPLPYYVFLPVALPACVRLIRTFAPSAIGHGTEAALASGTAFLLVGHRSVYASQKIGLSKSAGLEVRMDVSIGELTRSGMWIKEGSLTERVHRLRRGRRHGGDPGTPES